MSLECRNSCFCSFIPRSPILPILPCHLIQAMTQNRLELYSWPFRFFPCTLPSHRPKILESKARWKWARVMRKDTSKWPQLGLWVKLGLGRWKRSEQEREWHTAMLCLDSHNMSDTKMLSLVLTNHTCSKSLTSHATHSWDLPGLPKIH